ISGSNNSVIGNHFSEVVDSRRVLPQGAVPTIIRVAAGSGNYVATNHVVALDARAEASDSCFEAQVGALLTTEGAQQLSVTTVVVDPSATRNTVLDSGTDSEVDIDREVNAFRATPSLPTQ